MTGFLIFLVVLGFMVLIHEAGHFFAAKWAGVRVEAFAIGFGKRLFGVIHKGTDYRVNLLPLGGYVKMAGQDEMAGIEKTSAPAISQDKHLLAAEPYGAATERALGGEHEREIEAETAAISVREGTGVEFTAVPRWKRIIIALAGPVANFILAFLVLFAVNAFHHEDALFLNGPATLDYVPVNSAAAKAGLQSGDTITSIGDHATPNWQNLMEQTGAALRNTVSIAFLHNGTAHTSQIYLEPVDDERGLTDKIGIIPQQQPGPIVVHRVQPGTPAEQAGLKAGDHLNSVDGHTFHSVASLLNYLTDGNGKLVVLNVQRGTQILQLNAHPEIGAVAENRKQFRLGFEPEPPPFTVTRMPVGAAAAQSWRDNIHFSLLIGQILHGLFTRQVSMKNMSGPVGIEQQVAEASKNGIWEVASLTAAISLNLGIFNLLPIPILDGGLILFLIIESIARRDVKPVVKERVYQAAFVCILAFFCFVMWNDISRIITTHHS
ncbi:RIP metalloprotease RseP [Terriglobus sp.]|uniref:RIP metalloprotease RseP n=1 Tax=Terriglobus sp. TaxID=1889013 RepID=UPI003AFFB8CF